MSDLPASDGRLAGYRLVRKLAVGSRADLYLGVGSAGSVALKLFAPTVTRDSVAAELDALGRLDSPHLVRLRDVSGIADEHPVLVLERIAQGSVAALLASRSSLECGEAVTLLAPVAALVGELHDVGVAHGKLGASAVHLGAQGQPVLLGLGHCELFAAGSSLAVIDRQPGAARDRDALAALTLAVLARVREPADNRLRELTTWIESAPRAYEFPGELGERLFSCSEALPVSIGPQRDVASVVPARVVAASSAEAAPDVPATAKELPAWVPKLLEQSPVVALRVRAFTLVRGVRPRFWVAVGAVAVALILGIALIPSGNTAHSARAAATTPATPAPVHSVPRLPDEPLLASKILIEARTSCFRERSVVCLDGVDESSSEALASDTALIRQVQNGGELPKNTMAGAAELTLVERLGDSALIGLGAESDPASILVIRTKAGWRIRDVLSGAQATPRAP
jgi:eukaryotic-like serine/threonine-protein kinase